jgi:hypothetical protein
MIVPMRVNCHPFAVLVPRYGGAQFILSIRLANHLMSARAKGATFE